MMTAPAGLLLNHRKLHVPSAERQVHDEDVHIVPFGVHKLRERIARHRSAPGYGLPRLGELPHGKHGHVIGIGNRNGLLVLRLWLCILTGRKSVGWGKSGSVSVGFGGGIVIKK